MARISNKEDAMLKKDINLDSNLNGFDWQALDALAIFPYSLVTVASIMKCSVNTIIGRIKSKYGMTWGAYNKMRTQEHLIPLAMDSVRKNLKKGNSDITKFVMKNNSKYEENPSHTEVNPNIDKKETVFIEEQEERDNPLEGPSEVHEEPSEGSTP